MVDDEGAVAAVDAAAVDEQRLDAVGHHLPLDRLLVELDVGQPLFDPIEQQQPVAVALPPTVRRDGGGTVAGSRDVVAL